VRRERTARLTWGRALPARATWASASDRRPDHRRASPATRQVTGPGPSALLSVVLVQHLSFATRCPETSKGRGTRGSAGPSSILSGDLLGAGRPRMAILARATGDRALHALRKRA
jgi:hypothetical protein